MSALRRYVNTKARPTEHDLVGPHGPETASGEEGSVQPRGLNTVAGNFVHTATGRRCVHHALPDVGFFPQNPYWGERCASGFMRTSKPASSTIRPTRPATTYLLLNPRGRLLETTDGYESSPLRSSQTVPTSPRRRQGLRP